MKLDCLPSEVPHLIIISCQMVEVCEHFFAFHFVKPCGYSMLVLLVLEMKMQNADFFLLICNQINLISDDNCVLFVK